MTTREIYPWGMFEMDDETGLPKPPEGHFWRVKKGYSGYWRVELRLNVLSFSKVVESRTFGFDAHAVTKENILDGAGHVLTRIRERGYLKSDLRLLGDYPPKSLTHQSEGQGS